MGEVNWPPIESELREWASDDEARAGASRRQVRTHTGPYRAAISARIARTRVSVSQNAAAEIDDATSQLTRFDTSVGHIAAPFASILLRTESASSSEIENLTSGAKQIGLAEIGESDSANAKLIVSNVRAMESALHLSENLSGPAIIDMQRELLKDSRPDLTGGWRQQQVWIGGGSIGPHTARFVPPHHDRIQGDIDDLLEFIARTDIPVLTQVAIAHAQFETIHPFADGNGRTGRALVQAMLRAKGVTQNVTVPVSAGLLTDTAAYIDALTAYRAGDVEPLILTFAQAAHEAVINGTRLVNDLTGRKESWDDRLIGLRSHASARKVADLAFEQPVLDAEVIQRKLSITPASVYSAVDALVERGILTPKNSNRRNRIWFAPEILDDLDAFAARAKRV